MHAKFEGGNLKIERAVSILVKWVSIMWSNLKAVKERPFTLEKTIEGIKTLELVAKKFQIRQCEFVVERFVYPIVGMSRIVVDNKNNVILQCFKLL